MKYKTLLIVVTLFVLSLIASACQAPVPQVLSVEPIADAHADSVSGEEVGLTITATVDGWEAVSTVSSEWRAITLVNQSDGFHQAAFLRLADGKTTEDVLAVLVSTEDALPEWLTPAGGPVGASPGATQTVTLDLQPGNYVVLDPIPGPDGVPGAAQGYFMPLVVEASESVSIAPKADMNLELVNYAFIFDYDAITAGTHIIEVSNKGPQEAHEVAIIRLDDGATIQDFLASLGPDAQPGPPPGVPVAGAAPFAADTINYVEVEFEAGATYGLLCFVPSTEHDGQPHFMLGMIGQFTVPQ